jgi:hypothetical protein
MSKKEDKTESKENILNDILINSNVPKDIRDNIIKNYINLLEDDKILNSDKFEEILKGKIEYKYINNLINAYKDEINIKLVPKKNKNKEDSLLFMSKMNDKMFSNFRTKKCFRNKIINFNKCIEHLRETESISIIRNGDIDNFFEENEIYFDDENHRNKPKCDVLYRKVNNYFFVKNEDYFEKWTDFYFNLYTNIFAIFDLKLIKLEYHNNSSNSNSMSMNGNTGIFELGGSLYNNNTLKKDNERMMVFNKNSDKNDKYNEFNKLKKIDEQIKYLLKELPDNFTKSMYNPINIVSLINNRTKNILSKFEQIQSIENTNIEKVEINIKSKFNLTSEFGIFGNYSKDTYINDRVIFTMEFYDIDDSNFIYNNPNSCQNYIPQQSYIPASSYMISKTNKMPVQLNNFNQEKNYNQRVSSPLNKNQYKTSDDIKIKDELNIPNYKSNEVINDNENNNISIESVEKKKNIDLSKFDSVSNNSPTGLSSNNLENLIQTETLINSVPFNNQNIILQEKPKKIEWILKKRGEMLPNNSILGGRTKLDGLVYVGKINNSPGKVNLVSNTMNIWNYWVQNLGSSKSGYVLCSDFEFEWNKIKRGDKIDKNAIYCGRDENNHKVWVGKSELDEPGKITCEDSTADEPVMKNIWCHSEWVGNPEGYLLVIKTEIETHKTELDKIDSFYN